MLDAGEARLTRTGTVEITESGMIVVRGFEAEGATCRDVSALAVLWAIGELQRELMATLQAPGGGNIAVD